MILLKKHWVEPEAASEQDPQDILRMQEDELNPPCNQIMLLGPSGPDKSALVQAMAAAHNRRIIWLGVHILSKYVADNLAVFTAVFEVAHEEKPVVIFADDFDGLCATRGKSDIALAKHLHLLLDDMDREGVFVAAVNDVQPLDVGARSRLESVDMDTVEEE